MNTLQKPKSKCWLCIEHEMGEDGVPRFRGYRMFSDAPWFVSNTGAMYTALYMVEADTFAEAHDQMVECVRSLKQARPWKYIWPWVDPSREARLACMDLWEATDASLKPFRKKQS